MFDGDGSAARGVQPRGLSIRLKLSLVIGAFLAIAILTLAVAAYREMRASALAATSSRLDGIASQWARMFEASPPRQLAQLQTIGLNPAIRAALANPNARTRAVAAGTLRTLVSGSQRVVVQLVSVDRSSIVRVGDSLLQADPALSTEVLDSVAQTDSGVIGRLRAVDDSILATAAVRVVEAGRLHGFILHTSRIRVTPSPEVVNRLFGGGSTNVRLVNRDGSLWTDMSRAIPGAAVRLAADSLASYTSPVSGPVFAAIRPVARTPYLVVLETGQAEVLAQARAFLQRIAVEGALLIALGLIVAVFVSGALTGPLAQLTSAAEAVASGDYARHSGPVQRRDELGRLASAFDVMVSSVNAAFESRRAAEDHYRALFESVPLPLWVYDLETLRILAVNDAVLHHYGYSREEILAKTLEDIRPSEDVPRLREAIRRADAPEFGGAHWRHLKRDGTVITVETYAHAMEYQGRPARIAVIHDITEQEQAKDALRRLDDRLGRLVHDLPAGVTLSSLDGRLLAVNPACARILGYDSEAEVMAINTREMYRQADERGAVMAKLAAGGLQREELHLRRKDGSLITVLCTARIVEDPETGEKYVEAVTEDVTELRRVERQFQQAQKMEAVGQLAAGVAHDFNNLLTIVLSYTDMMLSGATLEESNRRAVEAIRDAALSAGTLTRQLLVFSRQEVVEPKVVRLNTLVEGSAKLLGRLLGEHVELATQLDPDAGAVKADAGQIEQLIVNLAVNARDAMPGGGRLLIECRNVDFTEPVSGHEATVPAGRYVTLCVSDNGVGMDAVTQNRIFEPFFTTKEAGRGTGLGLATVYGIVKQTGGYISVYSEPQNGTSFKICFPRCDLASEVSAPRAVGAPAPEGTESILIVEDQPAVRATVRRTLERSGYKVFEAPDGDQALAIAEKHRGAIHLLLTDVIMPRMGGRELAERVAVIVPDIRILFVSGYTDDAIVHQGVLERKMRFLQKPFTRDALLRKVREVLDAQGVRDPTSESGVIQ